MSVVLLLLQVGIAALLLVAATGKLLRSDEFAAALRLSYLPDWAVGTLLVAVPLAETLLAAGLLLAAPDRLPVAFWLVAVLLAVFTGWMLWVRSRRLYVRCGCFGVGGTEVGAATIARNGALLALAVGGGVLAGLAPSPVPGPSWPLLLTVVAGGLTVALVAAGWMAWPHLVISEARLARGAAGWDGES